MEEVLNHYGIQMNRGRVALCPFHPDRHPSLHIYRDGFYCFVCGAGGDQINFIARYEGLSNKDAAIVAGKIGGISVADDVNDFEFSSALAIRNKEKKERENKISSLKSRYAKRCAERIRIMKTLYEAQKESDEWDAAANRLPGLDWELDFLYEEICNYEK